MNEKQIMQTWYQTDPKTAQRLLNELRAEEGKKPLKLASVKALASRLGCARQMKSVTITEHDKWLMQQLRDEGMNTQTIADKFEVSRDYVIKNTVRL